MDKDHRLDAPNNDLLSTIEQIEDRSGVAAVYAHAHNEWEGVDLMSGAARKAKHDEEQIRINLAIRKWFPIIGMLVPVPAVLIAVALTLAASYLDVKMGPVLLLPVLFGIGLVWYLSYKAIKAVYAIFYNHSIKATPFLIIFVLLLAASYHQLHMFVEPYFGDVAIINTLLVSAVVLATSIVLCGVLLFIWTSRKLSSGVKVGIALGIIVAIIAVEATQALL